MPAFDARAARLLAPGEHLTFDEYPGLRLEASARFRTWTYRYKSPLDGRMRQVSIGRWPAMSAPAAIVAWEGLRGRREAGDDPAVEKRAARAEAREEAARKVAAAAAAAYTVRRVADDYVSGHVEMNRAPKGVKEVRRMFATMLGSAGDVPAADLTRSQAFDLIQRIAQDAPVQAQKLRSELGAAWDYAIDSGRLPDAVPNWWRLILRGKIRSKGRAIQGERATDKRVLSEQETGELIRWLPNFPQTSEDALTFYLWAGVRGSEIMGMSGREIARETDGVLWWTIPKARTKNRRRQGATDLRVPLFGRAEEVALRRMDLYGQGLFFPANVEGPPRPMDQKVVGVEVYNRQPYCELRPNSRRARLTVTHWAPHDLRRTARTLLAQLGCPEDVAEAVLGHMPKGIVGTYNRHRYDRERVEWLSKLAVRLEELAARR